ncbi:hypothetical protein FH972_020951 [Carpinus fangiana]|uniref:NmrA-like domain-containing protein n=1 Tax=Carpinus fangiana TaxID=176857 RepID=A0A5N6KNJ7_9ROSI|nr:hypothetical protein FH972_020951 [Carpinus fangiana]
MARYPSEILILGAGELGTAIAQAFASYRDANPSKVLRLTILRSGVRRNDSTSSELSTMDVKLVHMDIVGTTIEVLASTFSNYDTVISCLGFASGPALQMKIAEAAVQSTVKCFVPWQWGVDYDTIGRGSAMPLFDIQVDVRDLLRSKLGQNGSSISDTGPSRRWIIISTGIFQSFIVLESYGVVVPSDTGTKKVRALGSWETLTAVTRVEDIAQAAVAAVCVHPETKGIIKIAGQNISYEELAEVISRVTGKEVEKEMWGLDDLKKEQEQEPNDVMRRYRVIFGGGKGVAWTREETWTAVQNMMGVEEWLRKYWIYE